MATTVLGERALIGRVRKKLSGGTDVPISHALSALREVLAESGTMCELTFADGSEAIHEMRITDDPRWVELIRINGVPSHISVVAERACSIEHAPRTTHPRDVAAFTLLNIFCSRLRAKRAVKGLTLSIASR